MKIVNIDAREIFDSRGIPTIECEICLEDDTLHTASVPAGISKSVFEAHEKRDGGNRLMGLGVLTAVDIIKNVIAPQLIGRKPDLVEMDVDLLEIDGTDDKSYCGANTLLAVSTALCKAQAYQESEFAYEFIAHLCNNDSVSLPIPLFNVLGGGLHAHNNIAIQELLIAPVGFDSFHSAMDAGVAVFFALKSVLVANGMNTATGYEGEFVPQCKNIYQAFDILMEAIKKSGYEDHIVISLDCAASSFYKASNGLYIWENKEVDAQYLIDWYKQIINSYPIYSIEDGLSESDWDNWKIMNQELSPYVKIIGDDIFATNPQRIWQGIEDNVATTALIKPNQIGTITETLQSIVLCKDNGWDYVISHRSGETNDSFIADLAVGVSAVHIKAGGCSRGERMAKYNRLLQIEDDFI